MNIGREEQRKFNPWNFNNKPIPDDVIRKVLNKHGIKPKDYSLYQKACIHVSYRKKNVKDIPKGRYVEMEPRPEGCMDLWDMDNERIEFVGDALLGAMISDYLYMRYPEQGEGFLTKLRMKLVNNRSLGTLIHKMKLNEYLIISKHFEEKCDGRNNLKILGGMMEAWICAVFLDYKNDGKDAWRATRHFVQSIFETYCDFAKVITSNYNYKEKLLQYYQKQFGQTPKYKMLDTVGAIHERIFTMGVLGINGEIIASASARCKKTAEQIASKIALKKFGDTTIE